MGEFDSHAFPPVVNYGVDLRLPTMQLQSSPFFVEVFMEFVASFSGGKDSILSIKRMIDRGHRLVAIVVSSKSEETDDSSWVHNLDREYFMKIAELFRCEIIFTETDIENYEKNFEEALKKAKNIGARACVFGDIDIIEHILWNKTRCDNVKIECIHPLMFEKREKVVEDFLATGLFAEVIKVDTKKIPEYFIGERFDNSFIDYIENLNEEKSRIEDIDDINKKEKTNTDILFKEREHEKNIEKVLIEKRDKAYTQERFVDLCGENGEYHTRVDISSKDIGRLFDDVEKFSLNDVYVDNASTCLPKAPGVSTNIAEFLDKTSFSISRGSYYKSYSLSSKLIDIRDMVVNFFDGSANYSCIFSPSATQLINMVLRGYLNKGDEIIVDDGFHNSSLRVFKFLRERGIGVSIFSGDVRNIEKLIEKNTKMIFLTAVDNVYGHNIFDRVDAFKLNQLCKKKDIKLVLDITQAVLEIELSLKNIDADALICSSHIGFMASEGLGLLVAKKDFLEGIDPLVLGGTGSKSDSEEMPRSIPDRFEVGSIDLSSVFGLFAALNFIDTVGRDVIIRKKRNLGRKLRSRLRKIKGIEVYGEGSFCVVNSLVCDNSELAFYLDQEYGIMTRVGLHCSYQVHVKNNSFPEGGIRMSLGYFNNDGDVDKIYESIEKVLNENIYV